MSPLARPEDRAYENDVGTVFRIRLRDKKGDAFDLSNAELPLCVYFLTPEGKILTKKATLFTDGSDGILQYTTEENDLAPAGLWQVQAEVSFANGNRWASDPFRFYVHPTLNTMFAASLTADQIPVRIRTNGQAEHQSLPLIGGV